MMKSSLRSRRLPATPPSTITYLQSIFARNPTHSAATPWIQVLYNAVRYYQVCAQEYLEAGTLPLRKRVCQIKPLNGDLPRQED